MAATQASRPRQSAIRWVLLVAASLLVVGLLAILAVAAYALTAPYTSVAVPSACGGPDLPAPDTHRVTVPPLGDGILLARDGETSVVIFPAADGSTIGANAVVLVGDTGVARVRIASRTVAAGIADGVVYLFDDKLGNFMDATTGLRVPRLFTIDNYRGIYSSGGAEFVQTSMQVAGVGLAGRPFMAQALPFGAVVDGCLLASAVSG